jgi:hypothetical protein
MLAENTDLAAKALEDLKNTRDLQKNRESFVNALLTNTPEEADKLNQSLIRLQRNLSGGTNDPSNQRDARKAFNETLRSTGSVRDAAKAGNTVLANQRKETLSLMQSPGFRSSIELQQRNQYEMAKKNGQLPQNFNVDAAIAKSFNDMEVKLMKAMAIESGMINNPLVRQAIAVKENPNADPAMDAAANRYLEANGLKAKATEETAQQQLADSNRVLKDSWNALI